MAIFKKDPFRLDHSGFTLVEVLIAITVLSFISFSTYKMIDANTTTKEQVVKEDRAILQTVSAISRIDSDISQIYSPLYAFTKSAPTPANNNYYADPAPTGSSFDGKTKNGHLIPQVKSEDKSTLIFFSEANRRKMADSKESRYAWIKYSLRPMEVDPEEIDEKKKNVGGFELIRQIVSTDIYNSNIDWSNIKPQVLMDNIKSLEFSFWDEKTKKFTTSLQELNENKHLIRSLKLNFTWIDEAGNEQTVEKNFRVLFPYFNTKLDDMKSGAYGAGGKPPGISDPSAPIDPNNPLDDGEADR